MEQMVKFLKTSWELARMDCFLWVAEFISDATQMQWLIQDFSDVAGRGRGEGGGEGIGVANV